MNNARTFLAMSHSKPSPAPLYMNPLGFLHCWFMWWRILCYQSKFLVGLSFLFGKPIQEHWRLQQPCLWVTQWPHQPTLLYINSSAVCVKPWKCIGNMHEELLELYHQHWSSGCSYLLFNKTCLDYWRDPLHPKTSLSFTLQYVSSAGSSVI